MRTLTQHDWRKKLDSICNKLGLNSPREFLLWLQEHYTEKQMSAIELSEYIETLTGVAYTPRSVQRNLKKAGSIRTASEAFNLAIKKGRVSFAYQDPIFEAKKARNTFSKKQRFEILTRDNFTCQLCGATAKTDILEVDHITPLSEGGTHEPDNLRTLCNSCNVGKQHHDKEFAKRGFRFTITPK